MNIGIRILFKVRKRYMQSKQWNFSRVLIVFLQKYYNLAILTLIPLNTFSFESADFCMS